MIAPDVRRAIVAALRGGTPLDQAAHGAGVPLATLRREEAGDIGLALELSIAARPLSAPPQPRRAVVVVGQPGPVLVLLISAELSVHAGPISRVLSLFQEHRPALLTIAFPWPQAEVADASHHEAHHRGAYRPIVEAMGPGVAVRFCPLSWGHAGAPRRSPVDRLRAAVEGPLDGLASYAP